MPIGETPTASPLARAQAEARLPVTDRLHGSVPLDDFQRQLLILLNGTRRRADLLEALTQQVQSGDLLLHQDGNHVQDPAAIRELIERWLTPALESLSRSALLL